LAVWASFWIFWDPEFRIIKAWAPLFIGLGEVSTANGNSKLQQVKRRLKNENVYF
jgi:hypothetical protein